MAKHTKIAAAALDYVEEHLGERMDLETVAAALHYSKYHLHRAFSQTVGMTIHDYIQRRRLTAAAGLLVFSRRPILEIALGAGYESQQAFTAAFGELYKKTPGQFRREKNFYPLKLPLRLKEGPEKSGRPWESLIRPAAEADIEAVMALSSLAVEGFPGFQEEFHRESIRGYIRRGEALAAADDSVLAGFTAFSEAGGSIDFLAVHPQYRRQGIARAFLARIRERLGEDRALTTTTFRQGDKADLGYRRAMERLGFGEGELLTEFGYPTQRMVLGRAFGPGREEKP